MAAAVDLREHFIEERFAKLEGAFSQMNERLGRLENEMIALRTELSRRIDANLRWTLGILIPMWVTLIATILLKG